MGAGLCEPSAGAFDLADAEAVTDESVEVDPLGDDVAPRVLGGDLDSCGRQSIECLGLDQGQLVAVATSGEGPRSVCVAVAGQTASRDGLCRSQPA